MTGTLSTQVVMKENPSTEEQSERGTDAPQPPPLPTIEQSAAYQRAWAYFNEALFDGRLKPCLLNLSRHRGSKGFFAAKRWQKGDEMIHEISLNPDLLRSPPGESLSTLVHEHFPGGCMPFGFTCAELEQMAMAAGTGSCSTDAAGACNCDEVAPVTSTSATGTYTASGGTLTTKHDGTTSLASYCVEGNLLYQSFEEQPDGGTTAIGIFVLTKQ